jgi:hypothetical protein
VLPDTLGDRGVGELEQHRGEPSGEHQGLSQSRPGDAVRPVEAFDLAPGVRADILHAPLEIGGILTIFGLHRGGPWKVRAA